MPYAPFDGPRAHVKRAEKQAKELGETVQAASYDVKMYFIPAGYDGRLTTYYVQFSDSPPPECSFILREFLNNIRVALDIMIADVARLQNKPAKEMSQVKFPFAKDMKGLTQAIKRIGIGEEFEKVILAVHPINNVNTWIRDLHDIDIESKHRTILPIYGTLPGLNPLARWGARFHELAMDSWGWNPFLGRALWAPGSIISLPPGVDPRNSYMPAGPMDVMLPPPLPFNNRPSRDLLPFLTGAANNLIDTFAKIFDPRTDPALRDPLRAQIGLKP